MKTFIWQTMMFAMALLASVNCLGQMATPKPGDLTVINRQVSFGTDGSVQLNGADNAGLAWLNNRQFTYGTIEFDVKGSDKPQGSFVGIAYHGLNDSTYECVYFRPFNFLAEDAVRRSHSVQYIAPPKYDWPVLRQQYPNKYEQAVTLAPDPNNWFHVLIKVSAKKVSVFVNHAVKPELEVEPIVSIAGSKIAYWVGFSSPGNWKNLKITDAR